MLDVVSVWCLLCIMFKIVYLDWNCFKLNQNKLAKT
jgi:hypothetical protein